VRVLDLGRRLEPFGDPVGSLPLVDATLEASRRRAVADSGVDPARLCFAEHAIASAAVLRAFAAAAPAGRPSALAVPAGAPVAALLPVSSARPIDGGFALDVFLDGSPGASLEALRAEARPVMLPFDGPTERRELPRLGPPPHHLELPTDGAVAAHVEHWVHLLWLAPLWLPNAAREGKRRRGPGAPSWVGPGARVHRTAVLEGAIVGAGARIGAGCVVRHAFVGPNSHLNDFTKVRHSVLGPATHTLADASFSHVVAMGGGTLSNLLLRDTLLGRDVFLTTGVIFWNETLGENVQVTHEGAARDSGRRALGGCAGHGCVLGARTIVAPGRALPNRTTVVMRRDEGVMRVDPEALGRPLCWHEAQLVDAGRFLAEGAPDELDFDRRSLGRPALRDPEHAPETRDTRR
jgi:acetyltransferase-like isoleucine patch superfamily enzyme